MSGIIHIDDLKEQVRNNVELLQKLKDTDSSITKVNLGLGKLFTDISEKGIIFKDGSTETLDDLFEELNKTGFMKARKLGLIYKPYKVHFKKNKKKANVMKAELATKTVTPSISRALRTEQNSPNATTLQRATTAISFQSFASGLKYATTAQQKFGLALDFIEKNVPEAEIKYPNLKASLAKESAKELKEIQYMQEEVRRSKERLPPSEQAKQRSKRAEENYARWSEEISVAWGAMQEEHAKGTCRRFKIAELKNGQYFEFGTGISGNTTLAKIYLRPKGENVAELVHKMVDLVRVPDRQMNFQGKFFRLGTADAHNEMVLYVPFEELPRITRFLAENKNLFKPVELNHPLGVQLVPGVSALIASKVGKFGFDQNLSNVIAKYVDEISKKFLEGKRPIQPLVDELLKDPITKEQILFLLKHAS